MLVQRAKTRCVECAAGIYQATHLGQPEAYRAAQHLIWFLATAIEVPIFSAFSLTRYVKAACCIETYGAFCTWVSLRQYWGSGMTVGLISCTRRRNNTGMCVARDILAASHERVHFYCYNYSLKWAEVCVISCASNVLPCSLRVWIYVRVCANTGK